MKSKSLACKDVGCLSQCLSKIKHQDFNPNLAIVFTSPKHSIEEIRSIFNSEGIDLVGCTTAGEIVDKNLHEESIALLLLEVSRDYYSIEAIDYSDGQVHQHSQEAGKRIKTRWTNPGLVIMSGGIAIDADALIVGLREGIAKNVPMFGGLAGDELVMEKTFAFSNDYIFDQGAVVLIFNTDKIGVQGLAVSGWEPVGGVNQITRSEKNVVYEINEEPAYDVFMRYFGLSNKFTKHEILINIQTNYPLQIETDGGYILRSPLQLDEAHKTITLAAAVEEGAKFRFSNSPGFEVIDQTVEEFIQLKNQSPAADALILFSCKGRHGALGPMIEDEIKGLFDYWNQPMTGFLSYGEIGDLGDGVCAFHNETCSLLLLKEL